jgi:phenylacetic acid degradation operon negative regulatory protein
MKKTKQTFDTTRLIKELVNDFAKASSDALESFLFSYHSSWALARNMGMKQSKYYSSIQSLEKNGYVKKINESQFLITPKMLTRLAENEILESDWDTGKWDETWKIVVFDIPESKKRERNIFRSLIKRKGFVGIQNSVFIAPHADFNQLANLRSRLKIEKYVSFFVAKSAETDDDSQLKTKFNLK